MRHLRLFCYILITTSFLAAGCSPTHYLANENLTYLYSSNKSSMNPKLKIYHPKKDSTLLYISMKKNNLSVQQEKKSGNFYSRILLRYRIFKNYQSSEIYDSASVHLKTYHDTALSKTLVKKFPILTANESYLVSVTLVDKISNKKTKNFIYYYPNEKSQQYLIKTLADSQILMKNYLHPGQKFFLEFTQSHDSLTVDFFDDKHFKPAAPPFIENFTNKELTIDPDSTFRIDANQAISFNKNGRYIIRQKKEDEGVNLNIFEKYFPMLKMPSQLRSSLIYLTSSKEYNKLFNKPPKESVDEFWLKLADQKKQLAKHMIREYYNKVENANRFLTTYKRGWKTDRGVIYTIFGKPDMVYRTNNGESWVYSEEGYYPQIEFKFKRINYPLCKEYYELYRSPHFKGVWYRAVDRIRQGKIGN